MPWKEQTIMEQKIEFICEWRTGKFTITELCRVFNISRPTAYKIIARFENEGYEGLSELSRKPRSPHPNSTDEKMVNRILELKVKDGIQYFAFDFENKTIVLQSFGENNLAATSVNGETHRININKEINSDTLLLPKIEEYRV